MPIQYINTGTGANKGNGDTLRLAFTKINQNFQVIQSSTLFDGDYNNLTNIPQDISKNASPTFNNLTLAGNISIAGTSTVINSTVITTEDLTITLANNSLSAADSNGAGIIVNGPTTPASITYSSVSDSWNINKLLNVDSLSVNGVAIDATFTGDIRFNSNIISSVNVDEYIVLNPNGSGRVSLASSAIQFDNGNNNVYRDHLIYSAPNSGKVGIGIDDVNASLRIVGDAVTPGTLVDFGLYDGPSDAWNSKVLIDSTGTVFVGHQYNTGTNYPNTTIRVDANVDSYAQMIMQNHSIGNNASTDLVIMNDQGTDTTNYIDIGINSSQYSQAQYGVTSPGDGYLFTQGGNLVIGTQSPNKSIIFHAGGTTVNDSAGTLDQYAWTFNRRVKTIVYQAARLDFLVQNTSPSALATSYFEARNDADQYSRFGINSSGRTDGNILPGETFLYADTNGGTLHIGNHSAINFYTNPDSGYAGTATLRLETVTGNAILDGNLLPYESETYELGSTSSQWLGLYVGANGIQFSDGSSILSANGLGGGGITAVVQDTGPQLGGNLDLNNHLIVGGSYAGNTLALPTGGGATLTSGYEGGVTLRASTSNTNYATWNFAADGKLSFPTSISPFGQTTQSFGMGELFAWQDGPYWTIGTGDSATGAFGLTGIGISPGIESSTYLYLPDSVSSTTTSVTLGNNAGSVQIQSYSGTWNFAADGNLTAPGHILPNADLDYDLGSTSSQWRSIYVGTGTIYIGGVALGVNQDNYVTVDGNPIITVNTAGNLTVQGDVVIGSVTVSDTAPTANTGTQWFNSVEGRTYIAYNNQWVDANPTQIPAPETYLDDIQIDGSTLSVGDYAWTFGGATDTFPGDIYDAEGPIVRFATTSTAPARANGQLWFNSEEGRTYIKYNDAWVDANPTQIPSPETYLDDIQVDGSEFLINGYSLTVDETGTLLVDGQQVTGSGSNGWQLTSGTAVVSLSTSGVLTLPAGSSRVTSYGQITMETDNGGSGIYLNATGVNLVYANTNVTLRSNSTGTTSDWTFGADGILTLSTASTILGNGEDPNVYIETSTTATTSTWTFGTDGNLTLPEGGTIKGGGTGTDVTIVASTGTNPAVWTFAADGGLTLPEDGTIKGYYRPHIGTKLLVPLNALGDDVRYSPGTLPNPINSSTNLIAAGWNIVDKDGLTAVVTDMYYAEDMPPNNRVVYSGTLGSNPYPITFTSPDYVADVTSNITIVATTTGSNTSTWTFAADGSLTLPNGMIIDASDSIPTVTIGGPNTKIRIDDGGAPPGFYITTNATSSTAYGWLFGPEGELEFPQGSTISETIATTGTHGTTIIQAGTNNDLLLKTWDYVNSTIRTWNFDIDGTTSLASGVEISNTGTFNFLSWNTGTALIIADIPYSAGSYIYIPSSSDTSGSLGIVNTNTSGTIMLTQGTGNTTNQLFVNNSGTTINNILGGVSKTWTFGNNGNLTFPDATVQTTAYVPATASASTYTGWFRPAETVVQLDTLLARITSTGTMQISTTIVETEPTGAAFAWNGVRNQGATMSAFGQGGENWVNPGDWLDISATPLDNNFEVATVSVFKLGGTGNLYRITYVGCTSYGWAVNIERVALG